VPDQVAPDAPRQVEDGAELEPAVQALLVLERAVTVGGAADQDAVLGEHRGVAADRVQRVVEVLQHVGVDQRVEDHVLGHAVDEGRPRTAEMQPGVTQRGLVKVHAVVAHAFEHQEARDGAAVAASEVEQRHGAADPRHVTLQLLEEEAQLLRVSAQVLGGQRAVHGRRAPRLCLERVRHPGHSGSLREETWVHGEHSATAPRGVDPAEKGWNSMDPRTVL
jgi:hypothetical protein